MQLSFMSYHNYNPISIFAMQKSVRVIYFNNLIVSLL